MPDQITLNQLQESGRIYRKDLVRLPMLTLERSTKYMTVRPGVRYQETVFSPEFNAEVQAYAVAERQKTKGDFMPRTLATEFCACFFDFDPNQVISTILGHRASQAGEGAKNTPSAREIAASVVKNIGKKFNTSLFKAKKDGVGKTTDTTFDGFETILEREIAAGNISEAKGNLLKVDVAITDANADAILKKALFKCSDELREEDNAFIYCSRAICDAYNENYLMTHQGLNYNKDYNQPKLEGSEFTFAPMVGLAGSRYVIFSTKSNMLVGCDQMSDQERVEFHKYEPKVVTGELYMFFGTQFESIDPRRLLILQLPDLNEQEEDPEEDKTQNGGQNGGQEGEQGGQEGDDENNG